MASYYASPFYGPNGPNGPSSVERKWDDGTFSRVKKITMTANEKTLTSLQVHYGLEGDDSTVHGITFGGVRHGRANTEVRKEYNFESGEILSKMTGYYGNYGDENGEYTIIKSLTFVTNRRELGPVGPLDGTKFETHVKGKIVGFFGSTKGNFIDSIGVYKLLEDNGE